MSNTQRIQPGPRVGGFTLTELLVVITVIVLLFTVAAPSVNGLLSAGKEDGALGAIKAAVATARSYSGAKPPFPTGEYRGCALIATPARELRVVQHYWDGNGDNLVGNNPTRAPYRDTGDPQTIWPEGVGLVGITRNATGAPLLLAPPFAIRFDRYGRLIARQPNVTGTIDQAIYYDGNRNGSIQTSSSRASNYDPNASGAGFDPEGSNWTASNYKSTDPGGYLLPFEKYEAVIGAIAYSKAEFNAAGLTLAGGVSGGGINATARDWLLSNGKPVFFNRYTGESITP